MMIDLSTSLLGKKLKNPTILASGILGVTSSSLIRVANSGVGAITTKTICFERREGHHGPVIVEVFGGLLNSVGLSSPKPEEGIFELKKVLSKVKVPVIASFFSEDPEKFSLLAEKISEEAKPNFLEANLSCPNLEGKIICTDKNLTRKIVEKVKGSTKIPLIVKLSPNVSDIGKIAKVAEDAGADAISAINTVKGMVIDIKTGKPILGNKFGGLSGPCIKPIAVRCVYEIYQEVKIPIIGIGGINSGEDAIEMLMAGATAVGVGTGILYHDIKIFKKISNEIKNFMKKENYNNLKEIIGKAH